MMDSTCSCLTYDDGDKLLTAISTVQSAIGWEPRPLSFGKGEPHIS